MGELDKNLVGFAATEGTQESLARDLVDFRQRPPYVKFLVYSIQNP